MGKIPGHPEYLDEMGAEHHVETLLGGSFSVSGLLSLLHGGDTFLRRVKYTLVSRQNYTIFSDCKENMYRYIFGLLLVFLVYNCIITAILSFI